MSPEPARVGHGRTPWHCACHDVGHAIPSLANDCEQRTEQTTTSTSTR